MHPFRGVCCAGRRHMRPVIDDRVCADDLGHFAWQLSSKFTQALGLIVIRRSMPRPRVLNTFARLAEAVHKNRMGLLNQSAAAYQCDFLKLGSWTFIISLNVIPECLRLSSPWSNLDAQQLARMLVVGLRALRCIPAKVPCFFQGPSVDI